MSVLAGCLSSHYYIHPHYTIAANALAIPLLPLPLLTRTEPSDTQLIPPGKRELLKTL